MDQTHQLTLAKNLKADFQDLFGNNYKFIGMRHVLGFVCVCRQFNHTSSGYLVSITRTVLIKHLQEADKCLGSYNPLGQLAMHAFLCSLFFPEGPFGF